MILNRFPLMMLSIPVKSGIHMPLPIAIGGYRELDRPRTILIRDRRRTIGGKSSLLAARLMRFLGLRTAPKSKASPKVVAAFKRAQAITAITPQEYPF